MKNSGICRIWVKGSDDYSIMHLNNIRSFLLDPENHVTKIEILG